MTDEFMKITNDATKLHIENIIMDTTEGEVTITLPEKTGRYTIDIIPFGDDKCIHQIIEGDMVRTTFENGHCITCGITEPCG